MRPRHDQLRGDDRTDADLIEQIRSDPTDESIDLALELGGFVFACERPSCRGMQGHDGGELLSSQSCRASQRGTGVQEFSEGQRPQPVTQGVGRADDQRVQCRDRSGTELDRLRSCGQIPGWLRVRRDDVAC